MKEEDVINLINSIEKKKEEQHIEPNYALDIDLYKEMDINLRSTLNKMYKDGKITVSSSLNNKIIQLKYE